VGHDRLVRARRVVADASEEELRDTLLSGVVFEASHLQEIASSESGDLAWAVATIGDVVCRDLSTFSDRAPSPAEIYDATRIAIRVVRA
jgi:hypothetical protein